MANRSDIQIKHSQNFLRSRRLVDLILGGSSISSGELVLDVGAGRGLLTERLAALGAKVLAIERDPSLAALLRERFARSANVTIWEGDFLDFTLPRAHYKVFANIPFNLTTEVVGKLTAAATPPVDAYLAVQSEAADRFRGKPTGTLRAMLLMPWFDATVVHRFRRTDFDPIPQVDVVMLRLRKRGPPLVREADARLYRDFLAYCFTARRPRLTNTLERLFSRRHSRSIASEIGVGPDDTPSTLRFDQWLCLFQALKRADSGARVRVMHSERQLHAQQRRLQKVHRTRATGRKINLWTHVGLRQQERESCVGDHLNSP
jgi:23S rRNA (adenine-N6)-dimethyltransferase